MRLLLFSNSTNAGEEYLSYTAPFVKEFVKTPVKQGVFIPFAGISVGFDKYFEMVNSSFKRLGHSLKSLHKISNKKEAIEGADLIIIGGGNTFYLLKTLQDNNLIDSIRAKVKSGTPYIGWSAGSNMACPTIKTTNDMPIVEPKSFEALKLIPFQINPHFTDFKQEGHAGETREMRLNEFLLANPGMYVAGLREGTLIQVEGDNYFLKGDKACKVFKQGQDPKEIQEGNLLNILAQ